MKPNQDRKRRNYNKIFDSAKKASGMHCKRIERS